MATYLVQGSYTPEAWANLIANPHDRVEAVRPVIEKLGGKIIQAWLSFGDYDVVLIAEMPGNVEIAAFSLAANSSGGFRSMKTTPLLTVAEGIDAMKKASKSGYQAPGRAAHA